jgi:hypothetical protein
VGEAAVSWSLVTASDERSRCCVVIDGVRCEYRTAWLVGDLAELAYAYVCGDHLELVRLPGQAAEPVPQPPRSPS